MSRNWGWWEVVWATYSETRFKKTFGEGEGQKRITFIFTRIRADIKNRVPSISSKVKFSSRRELRFFDYTRKNNRNGANSTFLSPESYSPLSFIPRDQKKRGFLEGERHSELEPIVTQWRKPLSQPAGTIFLRYNNLFYIKIMYAFSVISVTF